MHTTTDLLNQHRIIEQVLNCLERMVDRCELHHRLESGPARDAIAFLRGFIERYHDSKVDRQLLPAVHAEGIRPERCLGRSLRQRREECRFHLDAIERAIESASAGNAAALKDFAQHARVYIELLLELIAAQEDCLFPMIARSLREADNARRTPAGQEDAGPCVYNAYVDLANRLADRLGVPRAVMADSAAYSSVNEALPSRCSPGATAHTKVQP